MFTGINAFYHLLLKDINLYQLSCYSLFFLKKDKWNTTTFNGRQQTVNSVIRDSSKDSPNISNTSNLSDKTNLNDSTAHLSRRIRW